MMQKIEGEGGGGGAERKHLQRLTKYRRLRIHWKVDLEKGREEGKRAGERLETLQQDLSGEGRGDVSWDILSERGERDEIDPLFPAGLHSRGPSEARGELSNQKGRRRARPRRRALLQ